MIAATAFSITVSIILAILLIRKPKVTTLTNVNYVYRGKIKKDNVINALTKKGLRFTIESKISHYSSDFDQIMIIYYLSIGPRKNIFMYCDYNDDLVKLVVDKSINVNVANMNTLLMTTENLIGPDIFSILDKELK